MNPAEYFMKTLSADNFMDPNDVGGDALENAKKRYEQAVIKMNEEYEKPDNTFRCKTEEVSPSITTLTNSKLSEIKYVAPWVMQFLYLCRRACINNVRSPQTTIIRFMTTVIVFLLGTSLYYDIGNSGYAAVQSRIGTQFYVITFCLMESIQNVVLVFPEERAVFLREQASSLYDISAYFLGKIIAELPFNLFTPLLSLLIIFWSWHLNNVHTYNFWVNLINMELMYVTGCGYGLIIGVLVADRTVLVATLPVVMLPLLLFSGFFVSITKDVHIMWLLHYLSPCKYGFGIGARVSLSSNNTFDIE
jgi:ATP-binding cassette subfamily G (WHITE) protein 1